ncbi:MAG: hypothetical protein HQL18_00535, partial [Candidatus Omnitrophica bacterium]|nr:hypothetical protein [Candidatus Omnitrophota bacterium]
MPIVATVGSAILFYLAFPNILTQDGFSLMGWLFAIPFLFALEGQPWLRRILLGTLWGIVAYGCLVHWLWPVSRGGYFLFVFALATQGVMFAILTGARRLSDRWALFYYPAAWVVSEVLRNALLGGFSWSAAYSQAFHPSLIQVASFGGAYAVSWIMLAV